MCKNTIDAQLCAKMFLAGAANLEANKEWINELNVFPVPDGDTGTNMTLTIMAAAKEVASLEDLSMETLAKAISSGSLRGARGNSGVILSQLLRGFTKTIKYMEQIDTQILAEALQKAVATAYKAVMKPKEGTILTVAKGFSDKASELVENGASMQETLEGALAYAEEVLQKTPEMLPVLKEAGVVDSGGQGLIQVLKGAFDVYMGKEVDYQIQKEETPAKTAGTASAETADIKYGYCTEFIIKHTMKTMEEREELAFKAFLESIGDSIVVVADDDIVKVHVHTNEPGVALTKALTYGELSRIKIDNMREEHQEKLLREMTAGDAAEAAEEKPQMPHKEVGFISVSIGEGIGEIFRGLGVDYLIEGGQTMNPSTEDMLNAIDQVNADIIYILPNNKNIILAANQAQALTKDKTVCVIPTKTVPQGIAAIISYEPSKSVEQNMEAMKEGMAQIRTGQVTYAVRDTHIDEKEIKEGDIMGIGDHSILSVGKDIPAVTKEMIGLMMDEDSELISVYYGADVTEEDAGRLGEELREAYPECEVEVYPGGQPIYYYVVSVE